MAYCVYTLHVHDPLCTPRGSLCVYTTWKWPNTYSMWLIVCVHFMEMTHYALQLGRLIECVTSSMWLIMQSMRLIVCVTFMEMTHYTLLVAHCVCTLHWYDPLCTPPGSLCVYTLWKWPFMHSAWLIVCTLYEKDPLCTPRDSYCVYISSTHYSITVTIVYNMHMSDLGFFLVSTWNYASNAKYY